MRVPWYFRTIALAASVHLSRLRFVYGAWLVLAVFSVTLAWGFLYKAPHDFPVGSVVEIAPGTSVSAAGSVLVDARLISSPLVFKVLMRLLPGVSGVQQGSYAFARPTSVLGVAWNLAHGISGIPTIRVTFPEGTTVRQMGATLAARIPGFDEQQFISIALPAEGYLFPDTYFFLPATDEEKAMNIMRANYNVHIRPYQDQFVSFGKSEREIITMASILEGEGRTHEEWQMIAGILWRRTQLGMPLQVDATFGYIYGKTGYVPTGADLKSNSAYNTYRYAGLPPTPINNPGEEAIRAALTPTKSDYLYYLTGTDGGMHYAKTFTEHIANQKKYFK